MIKNLSDQTSSYAVEVARELEEVIKFSAELGIILAVDEGLVDCKKFDIYKAIQMAQYLYYSNEVYADYSTLEQLHKLHRELAELEREQVA